MTEKKDPYASEAETQALMVPDTRMKAERKLAKMMAERGADEQGAEAYLILRQIAVELLAEQPAQGCEFCSHPLYAGTKCKNCGREQPAQPQQASDPDECASDVFEHGTSLGLFDMPKEDAEQYCKAETERTGYKHDWHYIGGRVHVKALITPQPAQQQEWIEAACALIKAADDAAADNDYMLDSDDCIKVLRGEWRGNLMNDQPTTPQPAQQEGPVPIADNTYSYAKSLAEAIFKQHFASDEHYASGRIVWGVNDTVIGILTQIDNMVADMVRRSASKPTTDLVKAAQSVLEWTEIAHRPPVRDALEGGRMVRVRLHALADLHDALAAHGIKGDA